MTRHHPSIMRDGTMLILLAAIALAVTANSASANGFLIGTGDLLEVRVYEQEDLNLTARVGNAGDIRFPLIGTVPLQGLTEREAEEEIARRLEAGGFLRSPHITVVIVEHVSNMVSVLGEVVTPGRYSLDDGTTIVDVIALANGTKETANDHVIVIRGEERTRLDLDATLRRGVLDGALRLSAGDIVYVPRMDMFYIYGEARQPGAYRLERNMNVMQALAIGGSLTERGSDRRITIRRLDEETGRRAEFSADLNDLVEPNDVIFVRERLF